MIELSTRVVDLVLEISSLLLLLELREIFYLFGFRYINNVFINYDCVIARMGNQWNNEGVGYGPVGGKYEKDYSPLY